MMKIKIEQAPNSFIAFADTLYGSFVLSVRCVCVAHFIRQVKYDLHQTNNVIGIKFIALQCAINPIHLSE